MTKIDFFVCPQTPVIEKTDPLQTLIRKSRLEKADDSLQKLERQPQPAPFAAKRLNALHCGETARVKGIDSTEQEIKRLLAIGFLENSLVESLYASPSGNPVAYGIHGVVLALRQEDAEKIIIE